MVQPDHAPPPDLLSRVTLFRGLTDADAALVLAALSQRHFAPGDAVVRQGDVGDELYIVEEGELTIVIEAGGRSVRVGSVGPFGVFGEMAVLRAAPRSATVTAVTPVVAWSLSRDRLGEVLRRNEALARRLEEEMQRRDVANALRMLQ